MKQEHKDLIYSFIFSICLCVGFYFICKYTYSTKNVEVYKEEKEIDSIKQKINDVKLENKKLDSIKNVKIEEVKNLDNDSTLKLFNELIKR